MFVFGLVVLNREAVVKVCTEHRGASERARLHDFFRPLDDVDHGSFLVSSFLCFA